MGLCTPRALGSFDPQGRDRFPCTGSGVLRRATGADSRAGHSSRSHMADTQAHAPPCGRRRNAPASTMTREVARSASTRTAPRLHRTHGVITGSSPTRTMVRRSNGVCPRSHRPPVLGSTAGPFIEAPRPVDESGVVEWVVTQSHSEVGLVLPGRQLQLIAGRPLDRALHDEARGVQPHCGAQLGQATLVPFVAADHDFVEVALPLPLRSDHCQSGIDLRHEALTTPHQFANGFRVEHFRHSSPRFNRLASSAARAAAWARV